LASAVLSTVSAAVVATSVAAGVAVADVRGPDVASHQHPYGAAIKWSSAAAGAQFAFVKATEGVSYTNPYFARDFAGVRSAGMVRGAYHFARPRAGASNAIAQARHYVAATGTLRAAGDLPPVLDLERNDGLKPAALISWTRAYLNEVARLTGRTPIIYTYPAFWRSSMANTTAFKKYPLWIATYRAKPILVGGWTKYTFWQYTDRARLAGISGPVDMSVFNGSLSSLKALANGSSTKAKFVPKLSANLSKTNVTVRSKVTMSGTTSAKLAGNTVYRQGYWSGSWHTWTTTKVSAKGAYTFTVRPTKRAVNTYRIYVRSNSEHTAAASRTVKLRVR
jgi:lysozyme